MTEPSGSRKHNATRRTILAALAALSLAGCASTASAGAPPPRTARFSAAGLSFDYPATWHDATFPMPPTPFTSWLVSLSPQPMHTPCTTRHGTHNTTISCGEPVSRLRPNSLVADWTTNTTLGGYHPGVGARIMVGGQPGRWLIQTASAQAPSLRATEMITVVVPTAGTRDSWHQLTAFLRGPDTKRLEAQLTALLRSVRWH